MSKDDLINIRKVAEAELKAERIREAIEKCKTEMKKAKWWTRVFPYKIVLIRRT